METSLNRAS